MREFLEDADLVATAADGNQEAFTSLVKAYRGYIYALAYRVVLNVDDALDVTQNVFLKLAHKIGQFNGKGSFRAWLAVVTTREAIDYGRRSFHRELATEPEDLALLAEKRGSQSIANPREHLEAHQRLEQVEAAMTSLSRQQRAILALRLREDMGPKEISKNLGISARQVRVQLHRAIAKVRKKVMRNEQA